MSRILLVEDDTNDCFGDSVMHLRQKVMKQIMPQV